MPRADSITNAVKCTSMGRGVSTEWAGRTDGETDSIGIASSMLLQVPGADLAACQWTPEATRR